MNRIKLTHHSIERFRERYDIDRIEVCEAMTERAWRNGRTPDCFSGRMHKFLIGIMRQNSSDNVIKIHAKNCYIFHKSGKLITVYSLADRYDDYMNTLKPYKVNSYYDAA